MRPALRELQARIAGNLDADLSVATLAGRAHFSERSFARAFRRETGQTPAAYARPPGLHRLALLGRAGVLDGLTATTHWYWLDRLRDYGAEPPGQRVVEQGKVVTAAGVSSGIDMALRWSPG